MFAVVKRLGEREISLDGHYEGDTSGAKPKEAPDDANEAEHPHVVLGEAGRDIRLDGQLWQHAHQSHAV